MKSTRIATSSTTTTSSQVVIPMPSPIKANLLAMWSIFEDPLTYSMGFNFVDSISQINSFEFENVTAFTRCSFIFEDRYYILGQVLFRLLIG